MKVRNIFNKIKIRVFLTTLLLGFGLSASSQGDCATETPTVDFLETIPPNQKVAAFPSANVQVYIHIIRKTNGTGGIPPLDAVNGFNDMQAKYAPYNICFALIGIGFLDFDSYYDKVFTTDAEFYSLMDDNNVHSNAIDIYIVPSTSNGINGKSRNIPGRASVLWRNAVGNGSTMAHEMGHCLGLYHTHETFFCNENISTDPCGIGSNNSNTCGDFICDTPADPNLLGKVDGSCIYTGGGAYSPLTNNIMSYAGSCRTHFTNDQKTRMLLNISNNQVLLDRLVPLNILVSNITFPFLQPNNYPNPPQLVKDKNYVAKNNISTSGSVIIGNGSDVRFLAENEIILRPEFHVLKGGTFKAKIDISCPPNFNFRAAQNSNDSNNNSNSLSSDEITNSSTDNALSFSHKVFDFNIMPNPTEGVFKLRLQNTLEFPQKIVLRDVLGNTVSLVEKPNSFEYYFSLSNEKDGLYMLTIYYSNDIINKRLIKN